MCIKLAYLRSLLKSAARKFCFGKSKNNNELIKENHYFKNELVDKETGIPSVSFESEEDYRVRLMIEEIAMRADLVQQHIGSAFNCWKSMKNVKECQDIPLEVLLAYCLYFVAEHHHYLGDVKHLLNSADFVDVDHDYCCNTVYNWMCVKASIYSELLAYPSEVQDVALAMAASLFGEWPNLSDRMGDGVLKLMDTVCDRAKEEKKDQIMEDDQMFALKQQDVNCDDDIVKTFIDELFIAADLPDSRKDEAFLLWKDLIRAKSYRTKDIRAQVAGAVFAVCLLQFEYRDIAQYANAPQSHLGRCQKMAYDWLFSKRMILRACRNYSTEMKLCAIDTALTIMGGQVNYRCGDPVTLAAASLFITFKKHGFHIKIEELPLVNPIKNPEKTRKLLEELNEYLG